MNKIFFFFLLFSFKSFSCTCELEKKSLIDVYHSTAFVLHAKVLSITNTYVNNKAYKKINFLVLDDFKNLNDSKIEVYTNLNDSDCGLNISFEGEEWFIWANLNSDNLLYSNQCTFSKPFNNSKPFEKLFLEKLKISLGFKDWYDEQGNLIGKGVMANGIPNGKWIYYQKDFMYAEGNYVNGKKNGEWNYYYDPVFEFVNLPFKQEIAKIYNSENYKLTRRIRLIETFENGFKNGKFIKYQYNGLIKYKENFKNNLLNGSSIYYFENGNIYKTNEYKDDILNGISTFYYENGNVQLITNYKNGLQIGKWYLFDKNGFLKCKSCTKKPKFDIQKGIFICP
jgi:antitoxin component YwqK of YwqJK toxin-antitoxin module